MQWALIGHGAYSLSFYNSESHKYTQLLMAIVSSSILINLHAVRIELMYHLIFY